MAFLSKFKTLIIIVVLIVLAFIAYTKFMPKASTTANPNALLRTTTTGTVSNTAASLNDGPGREFVNQLLAIQNIKFNTDIFNDPAYQSLQDFSRELITQPTGRPNPFAPLGQADAEVAGFGSSTGFVITNQATTSKPATKGTTRR